MNTQSLSSLISSPSFLLRGIDSDSPQPQRKGMSGEGHRQAQSQLAEDLYQPINRSELVGSEMSVQNVITSVSHSAEIQVTTNEGDVITISLSESEKHSRGVFQADQGDSKVEIYNESNSFESGFSISIEGDLNEDEQQSLTDLINKMSDVSDEFFAGNIETAFNHAQKIGLDTEQIAGFSMDLKRERSMQAVVAYQQTAEPEKNINTDLLKQAGDFLAQTKELMADASIKLNALADQKQSFTDLFAGVGQMNALTQKEVGGGDSVFLKMIENISNDIFGN